MTHKIMVLEDADVSAAEVYLNSLGYDTPMINNPANASGDKDDPITHYWVGFSSVQWADIESNVTANFTVGVNGPAALAAQGLKPITYSRE